MKTIFIITEWHNGKIVPYLKKYDDYPSAEKAISSLPPGLYQIEKIFVVS